MKDRVLASIISCFAIILPACDITESQSQVPIFVIDLYLEEEINDRERVEMSRAATEAVRSHARSNGYRFNRWQKRWERVRTWSFTLRTECGRFTFLDWEIDAEEDFRIAAYFPWGAESSSLELRVCLETQTLELASILEGIGFEAHFAEHRQPEWLRAIIDRSERSE